MGLWSIASSLAYSEVVGDRFVFDLGEFVLDPAGSAASVISCPPGRHGA